MSLFADYWREKGHIIAENDKGFMSAIIHESVCMVDNFYVIPGCRGTSVAYRLTMQIVEEARKRGCTQFAAEIYKVDPLYAYILRLHKHFGMSVIEDTPYKTTTAKRITNDRPQVATA